MWSATLKFRSKQKQKLISTTFNQKTKPQNNSVIFSDAKSVLQALENGKIDNTSVKISLK